MIHTPVFRLKITGFKYIVRFRDVVDLFEIVTGPTVNCPPADDMFDKSRFLLHGSRRIASHALNILKARGDNISYDE